MTFHTPVPALDGAALRRARKSLGLTQEKAADRIGVHRRTWIRWEMGDKPVPRPIQIAIHLMEQEKTRLEARSG